MFERTLGSLRRPLFAVGVFGFALNVLALTVPLHMMHVYDHVLTSRSPTTLLFISLLAVGLLAALGLIDMFRSRLLVRVAARFDDALSDRLFAAAVADRLAGRSENPGQPLRDLDTFRTFVSGSALPVLFDAPWAPIFIALIFMLHPLLGVVALAGAAVLLLTTLVNERATRRLSQRASNDTMAAAAFADSALRNAEVIEAMGMRPAIGGRWRRRYGAAVRGHAATADRAGGFVAIAKFWRPFLQVAMLSVGAWLAIENLITPGVMIASSIIMARALAPVEGAIGSWRGIITARSAYQRLRETLARYGEPPTRMQLPDLRGEVSVANLFVAPPRVMRPVVKGITFSLSPGEVMGVIGPNASGKSTLARALIGAWPILSGEIRLDGAALGDLDRTRIGGSIGYLPQDIELFDGTIAENIARFGDADPEGVLDAARLAGLHDVILRLPKAYDTPIGPGGETLSGGQRQRIGLARALYGAPVLVVLDEPNANLDAEGEDALLDAIAALKARGATVIVIAHRPNLVAMVDRLMVLRDGTIEMIGPRAEVLARVTRPPASRDGAPVVAKFAGR
ncbi:MAG: prtD [Xanthobacteraceae bacterium]|nr:prtD [Xanthobacteraceae bacterium]